MNTELIIGAGTEYKKYLESQIITQLVDNVSQRLGFKASLNKHQVFDMYNMCIYEQAWDLLTPSPWCAAFKPDHFHDLEYLEDLRNYYRSGYGRKANERVLCSLVNDMLNHLNSNDQPNAIAYFTHSSSLFLFLTALQAFKDDIPLRADNYQNITKRKWHTSKISPFASHVTAVKYDCPNDIEQEKVKFLLNENPIEFEWCNDGLCDSRNVRERYKEFAHTDCDKYFCTSSCKIMKISTLSWAFLTFIIMNSIIRF